MPATKTKKRPPFAWGQPVCPECWVGMKVKIGRPMKNEKKQACCHCRSDIAIDKAYLQRINPNAVPYPTIRKEEE